MFDDDNLNKQLKYLKGHIYASSAYLSIYLVLADKPVNHELERSFRRFSYLYNASYQGMRTAMIIEIIKFWDKDDRATSYHHLLTELKKIRAITLSDLERISEIRNSLKSYLNDIRIYRNQYAAHSDSEPEYVKIPHSKFEAVIAGMSEIYAILAKCFGEKDLYIEGLTEKLQDETKALWALKSDPSL